MVTLRTRCQRLLPVLLTVSCALRVQVSAQPLPDQLTDRADATSRAPEATGADSPVAVIGQAIRDLRFRDIRGLNRSLQELGDKRAYVLVFTTTSCPLVRRTWPALKALEQTYGPQQVQFVAVNVGAEDTLRDMAAQALEYAVPFPFVKDTDLSCARTLGVTRTPEVAVLDQQRRLVYRGRVDDQLRLGGQRPAPSRRDLEEALTALLQDQPIAVAETPVDGCLISSPPQPPADQPAPTWHQDVAPILIRRCIRCHHAAAAAPFALTSFAETAAQAEMLAEVILDERMPPWYANRHYGQFQNDPSLTAAERDTLLHWVRSGRAAGQPDSAMQAAVAELTAASTAADSWQIGKPDLVITMLEEHSVPESGFVPYRYSILPHIFLDETWVEAIEIRPDNPAVVHHCNLAYVTTAGAGEETFITGYVPGGQPMDLGRFGNGTAVRLPKNSALGLQIHLTTTGKPERSRISVGLRFPRQAVSRQVRHMLLDPRRFRIPPYAPAHQVRSQQTLSHNIQLLGLFTHMHVRGRDMTFFADVPGQPRETLLQIPNYNFEWQLGYEMTPGSKRLPAGTVIEAVAHFDNSTFNPYNPDPSRTVGYGLQTVDEMFNGFLFFVHEDEDLQLTVDPRTGRGAE